MRPSPLLSGNCLCRAAVVFVLPALVLISQIRVETTDALTLRQAAQDNHHHNQQSSTQRYSRSVAFYEPPDVTLVDMTNSRVSLTSSLSYPGAVLLQFIFTTCPTICPVMSGMFSAAQDRFGPDLDEIRMISISIDPEHDTPARLHEYAEKFKAKNQWLFLTGKLQDIIAIQKAFDVYRGDKMRHEPITFLRASPEKAWVRLNGLMSVAEFVTEYRRLLAQ